jgi:hypothetical protein
MDERNNTTILYATGQNLYQLTVVNRVEELFQVQVYTVVITATYIGLGAQQGLVSTAFWAKAVNIT